jgi:hypothetical protein
MGDRMDSRIRSGKAGGGLMRVLTTLNAFQIIPIVNVSSAKPRPRK